MLMFSWSGIVNDRSLLSCQIVNERGQSARASGVAETATLDGVISLYSSQMTPSRFIGSRCGFKA